MVSSPSEWPSQEYTLHHGDRKRRPPTLSPHTHIYIYIYIYTRDRIEPCTIRSKQNPPPPTFTWALDHTTIPPTNNVFFQPWCKKPGLCDKESLDDDLEFFKTTFGENGYSTKQIRWALNLAVRTSKPKERPRRSFFSIPRRHTADPAECWPNTTVNVLACHLVRSPVSFVLWRTIWDWGIRGFALYSACVVRCTSDRLVVLKRLEYKRTTGTYGLDIRTNRRWEHIGSTVAVPSSSKTPGSSLSYAAIWKDLLGWMRIWSLTVRTGRMAWFWADLGNLSFASLERADGPSRGLRYVLFPQAEMAVLFIPQLPSTVWPPPEFFPPGSE